MGKIDLLLIHWPGAAKLSPSDPRNKVIRQETWNAVEEAYQNGLCRAIGVSNFNESHLKELQYKVKPMVNQFEAHIEYPNLELQKYCSIEGIQAQSYSTLGTGFLLKNYDVQTLALSLHKSSAQVLLRWALEQNMAIIPKSAHLDRMRENINIFDFRITKGQVEALISEEKMKICWDSNTVV